MRAILILLACLFIGKTSVAQTYSLEYAKTLAKNGEFKQAIEVMDEVIASNSPKAQYYQDKANFLLGLREYEEVLRTLTTGIDIMPDSVSLYDMRGTLLQAFQLYKEAIADLTTAYEKTKEDKLRCHLLVNRGGTKYKIRDFEGAYADLLAAIRLDSTNIDGLNNLAAVCDEVNKPDETLKYLKKIITIDPNFVPAYINIGFKYQQLDNHKSAIEYFDKAIKLDPTEAFAYSNRSFSKFKLKDFEGAMKDINYSITLMPSNSFAYKIRALIQIKQKKKSLACDDLKKALDLGYTEQYGKEVEELTAKTCK